MTTSNQLMTELIDESIRARRRRLTLTRTHDYTLNALRAVDAQLDRNVQALASLGMETLDACDAKIRASSGQTDEETAGVHLLCAVAVQMPPGKDRDTALHGIVQQLCPQFPDAVRDALWFFPATPHMFVVRHDHVRLLLGSPDEQVRQLAAEIAGLRGARDSADLIARQLIALAPGGGEARRTYELAFVRMGLGLPQPDTHARSIGQLLAGEASDQQHGLSLLLAAGQAHLFSARQYLKLAEQAFGPLAHFAWSLATLRDPLLAVSASAEHSLPAPLQQRILAFAGALPGLIDVVDELTARPAPITSTQADMLLTVLGELPASVLARPIDSQAREAELRAIFLQAMRQSHVNVHNDADIAPWQSARLLTQDALAKHARVRYGQRCADKPVLPTELVSHMSPYMRQLLYWEQSACAQQPFGFDLSPYANARLQLNTLQATEWLRAPNSPMSGTEPAR